MMTKMDQKIKLISYFLPQKSDSSYPTSSTNVDPDKGNKIRVVYQSHVKRLAVMLPTSATPHIPSRNEARNKKTAQVEYINFIIIYYYYYYYYYYYSDRPAIQSPERVLETSPVRRQQPHK